MEASIKKLTLKITPRPFLPLADPLERAAPPLNLRGGRGSYCFKGEGKLLQNNTKFDVFNNSVVIVEVPLLFEGGFQKRFDRTIAVYTSQKTALARLKKAGVPRKDALARLQAQMDIRQKKRLADYSIDNNGTKAQTMIQVRKVYKALIDEKAR